MKRNKLLLTPHGFKTWKLAEDFTVVTKTLGKIKVPKGKITDLASTPRLLWVLLPPFGRYSKAAVVHDFLYFIQKDRKLADKTFYELMLREGTYKWKAKLMYLAVRSFGWLAYRKE